MLVNFLTKFTDVKPFSLLAVLDVAVESPYVRASFLQLLIFFFCERINPLLNARVPSCDAPGEL